MFKSSPEEKSGLEKTIDELIATMSKYDPDSESYANMVNHLVKLQKLQADQKPPRVSPDVIATVLAHIVGILIIVQYERSHILTSKAINFILRLK